MASRMTTSTADDGGGIDPAPVGFSWPTPRSRSCPAARRAVARRSRFAASVPAFAVDAVSRVASRRRGAGSEILPDGLTPGDGRQGAVGRRRQVLADELDAAVAEQE